MTEWGIRCLRWLGTPFETLKVIYQLMTDIQKQFKKMVRENERLNRRKDSDSGFVEFEDEEEEERHHVNVEEFMFGCVPSSEIKTETYEQDHLLCHSETLLMMKSRWDKLLFEFYDKRSGWFNPTKIPDIYDSLMYDVLHNGAFLRNLRPLYRVVNRVADFVVPQEYGLLRKDKIYIGKLIIQPLLDRIVSNLETGVADSPTSRVHLYFSSEATIHALRNVVLLTNCCQNKTVATVLESLALHYLCHGVFRLYENLTLPIDDPLRMYVNIQFSPGAALDPFIFTESGHTLPVSRPVPVSGRIPFTEFKEICSDVTKFLLEPRVFE